MESVKDVLQAQCLHSLPSVILTSVRARPDVFLKTLTAEPDWDWCRDILEDEIEKPTKIL
ncbi:MAG: hypothetical protein R2849_18760 [Thermomicrobiales bacterium]